MNIDQLPIIAENIDNQLKEYRVAVRVILITVFTLITISIIVKMGDIFVVSWVNDSINPITHLIKIIVVPLFYILCSAKVYVEVFHPSKNRYSKAKGILKILWLILGVIGSLFFIVGSVSTFSSAMLGVI
jgi:hypothetical protein